jgi:hypothetical protein
VMVIPLRMLQTRTRGREGESSIRTLPFRSNH